MIVVVRAGRADGERMAVERVQQKVAERHEQKALQPADIESQFGDETKRGHADQQTAAEGDENARVLAVPQQSHTGACGGDGDDGGEDRQIERRRNQLLLYRVRGDIDETCSANVGTLTCLQAFL